MDCYNKKEIDAKRTFAIISHPDAGKTTLTEKFLLFGGAIQLAGAVRAKKAGRYARSDWMDIEKERGISVTSSVMTFPYKDYSITLLDTPGHEDFSEDTYRVLTAVDSAVMVIDSAKGVESQTRKLLEICRLRDTPIITFINKLDREGKDPFELIDIIEKELALDCCPMTWPIGMGKNFKGVYNIYKNRVHLFSPTNKGKVVEGMLVEGLSDPILDDMLENEANGLRQDIGLITGASTPFDKTQYLSGVQTPVLFGSAINNFGIKELLDTFVDIAPSPRSRDTKTRRVAPYEKRFSGFVFKIQANMDPSHRDRIALMRVCSGKYSRGMKIRHVRINKDIHSKNAVTFLAQERRVTEHAYAGDIIGLPNHGTIKIGDTFSEGEDIRFLGIPNFAPEYFRRIVLLNPIKIKSLRTGLKQLAEEGTLQLFQRHNTSDFIVGVVGVLQFDVVIDRLKKEYNVDGRAEETPYNAARWIDCGISDMLNLFIEQNQHNLAQDAQGNLAVLAPSQWHIKQLKDSWPNIDFLSTIEHS